MHSSYDSIAGEWHAHRRQFGEKKYVDSLLGRLKPGVEILDLGCGTGQPVAEYLVRNNFRVVGVDQSANMLAIARRVVPEAELIHADMCEMNLTGGFAAAICWDSMFHVGRTRHQGIFGKLSNLLAPGGWLLLSAGATGHEGFTSEMFGHEFFYSGYEPEETLRLLRLVGFEIELCEEDDPSSLGHLAIIARKAA